MIGASVNVAGGWGDAFARRVNADVRDAVTAASREGAETAAAIAQRRRRTGRMAEIEVLGTVGTPTGWEGGFRSPAFYAPFHDEGTLGSRRRRLKASTLRRRQSGSGQARQAKLAGSAGIPPLRFLAEGRRVARRRLVDELNRL